MKKTTIIAALAVALGLVSLNASAATSKTASATLTPTLEVTGACAVVLSNTNTALRSPPAVSGTTLLTANIGTVTVQDCTNNYFLGADGGAKYGLGAGGVDQRALFNSVDTKYVSYTLDITGGTPEAGVTNWGTTGMLSAFIPEAAGNAVHQSANTNGALDSYVIKANFTVPVVGTAPAGTYVDTVNVRVDF